MNAAAKTVDRSVIELLRPFGETVRIEPSRVNRIGAFGYVVATVDVAGRPIEEKEWTAAFGACQSSSTPNNSRRRFAYCSDRCAVSDKWSNTKSVRRGARKRAGFAATR